MSLRLSRRRRLWVCLVSLACLLVAPWQARAQGLTMLPTLLLDTTGNCTSTPEIDRAFGGEVIFWNGHSYLFANIGNEIRVWNVDDPVDPEYVTTSSFEVPNLGDSDYDLQNFSICDDCRYGIASYKIGTVLFDLGAGDLPVFVNHQLDLAANDVEGAFAFKYNGQQYLIASDLPDECVTGDASLYTFNGVGAGQLGFQSCVLADGEAVTEVYGGFHVPGVSSDCLYLGDRSFDVHIFRINEVGSTIGLEWVAKPMSAYMVQKAKGMAVDLETQIAVTATLSGLQVWDISDAASPTLRSAIGGLLLNRAAVRYPFVWVARRGIVGSERTYDVSNLDLPVPLDQGFWDSSHPWNYPGNGCVDPQGAVFSLDPRTMYLVRYGALQMVELSAFLPPTAHALITPSPAYPGDATTVVDVSIGTIEGRAIWITTTADPYGSPPVAGSSVLSAATPETLDFTIPIDLETAVEYWAHVAVESAQYPYVPGSTPDQIVTVPVVIDRAPDASIAVVPENPITGDTATITGSGEGHPSNPDGVHPAYEWWITRPGDSPYQVWGQEVAGLDLDTSGLWELELTVYYEHAAAGGGFFTANSSLLLEISTVAADFVYSPTGAGHPRHDEDIYLNGTSSSYQVGATISWDWDVLFHGTGSPAYVGCPSSALCTIPAETLDPGLYDLKLTLTNTGNGDVSTKTIASVQVFDGSVQLDFSWVPSSPSNGEVVLFSVEGVDPELDWAQWNFGGSGCPGFEQQVTCIPLYTDCKQQAYRYATAGTKVVTLTVQLSGGALYGPVQHPVSVEIGGGCGCVYVVSPSAAVFSGYGGSGVITVTTLDGCPWTASTTTPWITIVSGSTGVGIGTVEYSVGANDGGNRAGAIAIAGKTVMVTQAAMQWQWQRCVEAGFGDPGIQDAGTMAVFGSQLYVGARNIPAGAEVWTTANGLDWYQVVAGGFGDAANEAITDAVVFDGELYVAIRNEGTGCEVWKSPDGVVWSQCNPDGFGSADNVTPSAMTVFAGDLFVGTFNDDGAEVWRTSDGAGWEQVNTSGFGDSSNRQVTALLGFDGQLYAGVENGLSCAMWRRVAGTTWEQVSTEGFGDPSNSLITSMLVDQGALYAATSSSSSGGEIWRSSDGESWSQVGSEGFGLPSSNLASFLLTVFEEQIIAGTSNSDMGGQVWTSVDGDEWVARNLSGFGDLDNLAAHPSAVFRNLLYVGTQNPNGIEIWRTAGFGLVFSDGFEDGSTSAWGGADQSAQGPEPGSAPISAVVRVAGRVAAP